METNEISELLRIGDELRELAITRYGWHWQVQQDAIAVGKVLCGDVETIVRLLPASPVHRADFYDPCLWSLIETLLDWRRHHEAGTLSPSLSNMPPSTQIQDVADYLQVLGMWGENTEYDHPTQVSESGRAFLDIPEMIRLSGWTTKRLAELYALAEDPQEIKRLELLLMEATGTKAKGDSIK